MEKVRYEEMLPHEILARRRRFPAAFIGLGCLEWHSEHLAVGLDALKSEKLCEMAARRSGGFVFPTLWYGEPRVVSLLEANHDKGDKIKKIMKFKKRKFALSYFGKSGEEQIKLYKELLRHILIQMNTLEMKAVCLLCGHYPLYKYALPVIKKFNKEFPDTRVFAGIEFHYPLEKGAAKGDHAAKWETSYLWYLRPDCVDLSVYQGRGQKKLVGIMGEDPRKTASRGLGERACNLIVEGMVKKAGELIKKSRT